MKRKFYNRGKNLTALIISLILLLIISYSLWYFVFNIYEVKYEISSLEKSNGIVRQFSLESIPLNLLGKKVPFRSLEFESAIIEGNDLITVEPRKSSSELIFNSVHSNGVIVFLVKSKLDLFKNRIEFDLSNNL